METILRVASGKGAVGSAGQGGYRNRIAAAAWSGRLLVRPTTGSADYWSGQQRVWPITSLVNGWSGLGLGPILGNLAFEEGNAAGELIDAIHAVFNADPIIKADPLELSKNGVVVV